MEYIELAFAAVGGIYAVIIGLEKIAAITPSTKDDIYVSKAKRFFGLVSDFLSKIIMSPRR